MRRSVDIKCLADKRRISALAIDEFDRAAARDDLLTFLASVVACSDAADELGRFARASDS
jgi:hypothetical protein